MKVVILCGGKGTRLKEETEFKPKSMVLIGGKPILWHIMKTYSHYGYNEFILTLGYKGEMIREYFLDKTAAPNNFKIIFAETGLDSLTGERLLRTGKYITEDDFMVTYGDGVANIDISELVDFHKRQGTLGTISGVHPHSKYGMVKIDEKKNLVINFEQKPKMHDFVSGGFMVFKKEALNYFDNDWLENGLVKLAQIGQLSVFKHEGFWKSMDTYNEMEELNKLWSEKCPWAVWENK